MMKIPKSFMDALKAYFKEMAARGKIAAMDFDSLAMTIFFRNLAIPFSLRPSRTGCLLLSRRPTSKKAPLFLSEALSSSKVRHLLSGGAKNNHNASKHLHRRE